MFFRESLAERTHADSIVVDVCADVRLVKPGPIPVHESIPTCDDPRYNVSMPLGGIRRGGWPILASPMYEIVLLSEPVYVAPLQYEPQGCEYGWLHG